MKTNHIESDEETREVHVEEVSLRHVALTRHTTVRIPRGIIEAIEDFLRTEQAAKMGFDSKADVVTAAVRNLLSKHGYYKISQKEAETY